jgi:Tfp pilus assembly protein PilX
METLMSARAPSLHCPRLVTRQRGVVLFIALIALVAMTLAGIGLARSVDTATLAIGNMAFRKGAVSASDVGIEAAIAFLNTRSTSGLNADDLTQNYYSTYATTSVSSVPGTFATDIDGRPTAWPNTGPAAPAGAAFAGTAAAVALPDGNTVTYAIQRMCVDNLDLSTGTSDRNAKCITDAPPKLHQKQGIPELPEIYYRITVMTMGPRNTRSFVQAMVSK